MTVEVPEMIETELSEGAMLLPKWFQRLTAICAVAIPIVIPATMYWLEERSSTQARVESVAYEISSDAMRGVATMHDTVLVIEDIIRLHEIGLVSQIESSGFRSRFLQLRDDIRIKTVRTGAEISAHLFRFRDTIPDAVLQGFAEDARKAANKGIQPFGECLDKIMPLVLTGQNPKQEYLACNLSGLASVYLGASIAISEEAVSLGRHGRYDAARLRDIGGN